jgi:hypothetical protein
MTVSREHAVNGGIDVDAEVLEASARASAHAYDEAITHVEQEIKARDPQNLTALINTLAEQGPYAYTILPEVSSDGSVRLPVLKTREQIAEAYAWVRGMSDLHAVIGLTEVRGAWYTFQDNISRAALKGSDVLNNRQTLALFPSGAGRGITGELVWVRVPRSQLGAPDEADTTADDPLLGREQVYDQYHRYLDALRANDPDAVVAELHDGVASAIRDLVEATGTLTELSGKDAHRTWYREFFERYEVRSVQPLCQVTEDWYVFAELRIVVAPRGSTGTLAFNTAEIHLPAKDGRFIARIGHGTEPR